MDRAKLLELKNLLDELIGKDEETVSDREGKRISGEGRKGVAVMIVGGEEMTYAVFHLKREQFSLAEIFLLAQDGQFIGIAMDDGGDAGCIVGRIGFVFPGLKSLFKALAFTKEVIDRIGLVSVGDDDVIPVSSYGVVDDQGRIGYFGLIISLGEKDVFFLAEDAVAGIGRASHDEVSDDGLSLTGADQQASSGIGIVL